MSGPKDRILKLRIDETLVEELDALSSEIGDNRSEVVRELLEDGVEIRRAIGECVGKDRERLKRLLRRMLTDSNIYEFALSRLVCTIESPDYWEWSSWILERGYEELAFEVADKLLREYNSKATVSQKARIRELFEGTSFGRRVIRNLRDGKAVGEGWPQVDSLSEWSIDEK